jgi:hypothetical protein
MVFTPRRVRSLVCALAAGFAACLAAAPATAQVLDNKGREFLMAFIPNGVTPTPPATGVELHLTGDTATTVTIEYPALNPTTTLTAQVTPGQVTIVPLPVASSQQWTANQANNNLVRASASQEFVVYMVNRAPFSSDAALALPIDSLNTEYVVMDWPTTTGEFAVFAAFDETTVTITPTAAIGSHPAGTPFEVQLNRGQGFFASGAFSGAVFSGTRISANRPVGLSNGNPCVAIPGAGGFGACDHIFEVSQPVQSWGTSVPVANLPHRSSGSHYRIIAGEDGTQIALDGTAVGPVLSRGQIHQIENLAGNHLFTANHPIFVVQFMPGQPSAAPDDTGDPAMGNMVPSAQYQSAYTFATLPQTQFPSQFLTVIADSRDTATITLDGTPIGAQAFSPIGSTGFSAAVLALGAGNHNTASAHPHGITVEGYGGFDSYLYVGGGQFAFINPAGDANPPICELNQTEPNFFSGSAQDNRPSEDTNGNGRLDVEEDLNDNGEIDEDTGIFSVQLVQGAQNLSLQVSPFVPGDGTVTFQVTPTSPQVPFSGAVRVSDGAGNTCEQVVGEEDFPAVTFTDWAEDVEVDVEEEIRTAYVAVQEAGVRILDVSNPDAIAALGSYAPGTCPNGTGTATFFADDVELLAARSALFVAAGRCGVIVLNVSNPASPVVLGRFDTPVWAEAVEVVDNGSTVIGYIADHNGGLVIVNFAPLFAATPGAPVRLGGIGSSTTGWGTGAAIDVAFLDNDTDLLVFVAATQGLRVVNVNNPASPQLIGGYNTASSGSAPEVPQDVTLSDDGSIAVIAAWQGGLLAINVSNPAAPALLNKIATTPGNAYYESEIDGRVVFATEGKVGMRTFLLGDGGLSTIEGETPVPVGGGNGWAWDVETNDDVAYVTWGVLEGGTGGLTVIELEPSVIDFSGDDADGDGTPDASDNCTEVANPGQADVNQDGFGDACDADYDGDGVVNVLDFGVLRAAYLSQAGGPRWNAAVDHNGDGVINVVDFGFFRESFLTAPGPSGLHR